ncbi:hypothetical protein VTN96DRAFT_9419 [Rasamsonia emersonii]
MILAEHRRSRSGRYRYPSEAGGTRDTATIKDLSTIWIVKSYIVVGYLTVGTSPCNGLRSMVTEPTQRVWSHWLSRSDCVDTGQNSAGGIR